MFRPSNKNELKLLFDQSEREIEIGDYRNSLEGRINFKIHEVVFKTILFSSNCKRLVVFFSAQGNNQNIDSYPIFQRLYWARYFDGVVLYLDDPTRTVSNFSPCWYLGTPKENYLDYIYSIISKISSSFDICNNDIYLIGSSNSGFPACYIANKLSGSNAICLNPQINIPIYLKQNRLVSLFVTKMGFDMDDSRLDMISSLMIESASNIILSFNRNSDIDESQLQYLLKKNNKTILNDGLYKIGGVWILAYSADALIPHRAQPQEDFVIYLTKIISHISSADCIEVMAFVEKMKQYYQIEKKNYLIQCKDLESKTARIDIKSIGSDLNAINIISISDRDSRVIEPPFMCDEKGRGMVVTSKIGLLDIKIRAVGSGKIKIWLRGMDIKDERNNTIPDIFVVYTNLIINGVSLISDKAKCSVDHPYVYFNDINDGDIIDMHLEWEKT